VIVYIQDHPSHAGHWIYNGYYRAWVKKGFEAKFIKSLDEIDSAEYLLMITDSWATESNLKHIEKSKNCFLFCSSNSFPKPWGLHPNFVCSLPAKTIEKINQFTNVVKWTFSEVKQEYYNIWQNVRTVPLAFDDLKYQSVDPNTKDFKYDICFVGGYADNGFNEKIQIMNETLTAFLNKKFNCAFSVGQNISHEQENYIMKNSKIALNIHDKYQRVLKLDANERTFKSLGINGLLVSDENAQIDKYFPDCKTSNDPEILCEYASDYLNQDVCSIKSKNIEHIKDNHTYFCRVNQLLNYAG